MNQHINILIVEFTSRCKHATDIAINLSFEMLSQHKCRKVELADLGTCPAYVA